MSNDYPKISYAKILMTKTFAESEAVGSLCNSPAHISAFSRIINEHISITHNIANEIHVDFEDHTWKLDNSLSKILESTVRCIVKRFLVKIANNSTSRYERGKLILH